MSVCEGFQGVSIGTEKQEPKASSDMFAKLMGRRLYRKPSKSESNGTAVTAPPPVKAVDVPSSASIDQAVAPVKNGLKCLNDDAIQPSVGGPELPDAINHDPGNKPSVVALNSVVAPLTSPIKENDVINAESDHSPNGSLSPTANLPLLRDVPWFERQDLLIKKLNLCCLQYDFSNPKENIAEKEIKRQTLLELVDYVQYGAGTLTERVQGEIAKMFASNLFRSLPPACHESTGLDKFDREEEDPCMDPAWPHLQIVYELLLRYIISADTDPRLAKRYIDRFFVQRLLNLFDSEDPREREYAKTILHRIYGKYMMHRPFIRKAINNIFYRFIYETERHNGISELLEILGSIINGFALPLKEEHKLFLSRALLPLHKPKCLALYHQQLSYCITQFVEKDFTLVDTVIRGLLRYWPVTNSQKEVLFLGELEEVLEITQSSEFQSFMVPLFRQIGRCLNCSHFQVAERALFFWSNDHIVNLVAENRNVILPLIFEALEKNTACHWHQAVHGRTMNVRKMFIDMDENLFKDCQLKFQEDEAKAREIEEKREVIWKHLEAVATSSGLSEESIVLGQS